MSATGNAGGRAGQGPGTRVIALVGPFQSGKTSLFEAILERCGALERGSRKGHLVGDMSPEARAHGMTVEPAVATVDFMGDRFTFIDCPGSVEFLHDMRCVLSGVDAAVVVCEADDRKTPALSLVLRELEEMDIPHALFLNKIDTASRRVRETLASLQQASRTPLLLRQIPIWKDGIAVGFIDLALERAFIYREHAPSEVVPLPNDEVGREKEARYSMLERLADYDDALMEDLLSEIEPPRDRVFDDLSRELRDRHVVPVLIGAAERGNGVTRLLKALRHEAPGLAQTRARLGVPAEGAPLARVLRSYAGAASGKLSLVRVLRGAFAEGDQVTLSSGEESRIAGLIELRGTDGTRKASAAEGDAVAMSRLEAAQTGMMLQKGRERPAAGQGLAAPQAVFAQSLHLADRKDEVRLTAAIHRLIEEDPSLSLHFDPELAEIRLEGQGEMHLRVALERLKSRAGLAVTLSALQVRYRETIRQPASAHGRHKKQSGGHGQFGDVALSIRPLPRGEGFRFIDAIKGGVVPRQYIPSVEIGCVETLKRGPLGFPVVDVEVTLTDGSYHAVDSSDMAFRAAARIALHEALQAARPVLLEPVLAVALHVPSEAMSRASALVSARRGQILGYDARPDWNGWDTLQALVPEAEMGGLIVELRSATAGVGTFEARLDHLAELGGRHADEVVAHQARHLAAHQAA